MKMCTRYRQVKPSDAFHKDNRAQDNLRSECKECRKIDGKRYYAIHGEQIRNNVNHYRKTHRELISKAKRAEYERHKDKYIARAKRWQAKNPDKVRASNLKWIANHPKKMREIVNRKRARKENAEGSHTFEEFEELCEKASWKCLCCGIPHSIRPLTEDHIVPLSKGGEDSIGNIQPLCMSCNCRKSTKTINYWEENYA